MENVHLEKLHQVIEYIVAEKNTTTPPHHSMFPSIENDFNYELKTKYGVRSQSELLINANFKQ